MLDNSYWQIPKCTLCGFVLNEIPAIAWRTPEKVQNWIKSGGLEGGEK